MLDVAACLASEGFEHLCLIKRVEFGKQELKDKDPIERERLAQEVYWLDERMAAGLRRFQRIILLDDIITTGATLRRCHDLLQVVVEGEIEAVVVLMD